MEARRWIPRTYLITTLSATNVDNDIAIRELGQCLRDNGLAASESPWNGSGSSLHATVEALDGYMYPRRVGRTGIKRPGSVDQSKADSWRCVSQPQVEEHERATIASWCVWWSCLQILSLEQCPNFMRLEQRIWLEGAKLTSTA